MEHVHARWQFYQKCPVPEIQIANAAAPIFRTIGLVAFIGIVDLLLFDSTLLLVVLAARHGFCETQEGLIGNRRFLVQRQKFSFGNFIDLVKMSVQKMLVLSFESFSLVLNQFDLHVPPWANVVSENR